MTPGSYGTQFVIVDEVNGDRTLRLQGFDLGVTNNAIVDCSGFWSASAQAASAGTTAWTTGIVSLRCSNHPDGSLPDTHPTGFKLGGVATTITTTPLFEIDHRKLIFEVTTIQAGVKADLYVWLRKRPV